MGPFVINSMRRKSNLLYGHITMGFSMLAMGFLQTQGYNIAMFSIVCLYAVLFQTSQGPMIWIYSQEVTIDTAGALTVFGVFGWLFLQSLVLGQYMDQPHLVFYTFGTITLIGFAYVLIFIKDTTGLSDREKKTLYTSKKIQDDYKIIQ